MQAIFFMETTQVPNIFVDLIFIRILKTLDPMII